MGIGFSYSIEAKDSLIKNNQIFCKRSLETHNGKLIFMNKKGAKQQGKANEHWTWDPKES